MSATMTGRHKLRKQLQLLLGDGMIDIEADQEHLDLAIDLAVERARQRTDGSQEEAHVNLTIQPEIQSYTLPKEIQEVRKIWRRGVGSGSISSGINFDPFEASFSSYYLLQTGRTGGLATWDIFSQYQETLGRVFGSELDFIWEPSSHKLTIIRKVLSPEDVLVQVWTQKPEEIMFVDTYLGPWIRDYSLANLKVIIGEARSKFSSGIAGANGNINLNGTEMKNEGLAKIEKLDKELENFVVSNRGMPFIIG